MIVSLWKWVDKDRVERYRLTVELPSELGLVTVDARRDGRRCAINVQLLVDFVLIPEAVDERSIFGHLCVGW